MPDPNDPYGSQPPPVQPDAPPAAPGGPVITPTQPPAAPAQPAAPADPDQPYSFITGSEPAPKRSLMRSLPGSSSVLGRIGIMAGGLLIALILILILRSVVSGGGVNAAVLLTVAQDQQAMIHLTDNASEEQSLSGADKNFVATLHTSVKSSQTQLIAYLATNHKKLNEKQLNLKVSAATDEQLTAASTSGTYRSTFQEVMRAQLNTYGQDLQKAYKETKGKNGRALLDDSYKQALLLASQLNSGT